MIPSDVCSSAVRGSWSFYGNHVLSWMKTRGKQTKMTKWGVKLDSIPGSALILSKSKFKITKLHCVVMCTEDGRRVAPAARDVGCTLSLVYLITQIYSWPQESQNDFIIFPPLIGEMNAGMFYQLAAAWPC